MVLLIPSPTLIAMARGLRTLQSMDRLIARASLVSAGLVILGRLPIRSHLSRVDSFRRLDRRTVDMAFLISILIVAGALRLYSLNSGLWLDEINTYVSYARMPFREILSTYGSENQHFLYSILAHASFLIFGESAWSLRLPAVLFGMGSIWAVFLLGREVGSRREALLAAVLLTFSYHHIWFSQNARGYTGLLFWTILSSWLLIRGLRENKPHQWLLYAAASAFGVYTQLTMLFVILGQFVAYTISQAARSRRGMLNRWRGIVLGFGVSALFSLLLHALVLPELLSDIAGTVSVVDAWKRPIWTLLEIVEGLQIGFSGSLAAIVALILFVAGLWGYARTNPIVIQLLVIPPLIGGIVVVAMGHHLWPRFFFFALGFSALVVVRGSLLLGQNAAERLKAPSAKSVWIGTATALALILASAVTVPLAYGPKQDYQAALAYVESMRDPGDAVVTVGIATFPYSVFYDVEWKAAESAEELEYVLSHSNRTWLVYTFQPVLNSVHPDIMALIRRNFAFVEQFPGTLPGGHIFVYRSEM